MSQNLCEKEEWFDIILKEIKRKINLTFKKALILKL